MPIDSHLNYLQKNRFAPRQISESPAPDLGIVVVIPCHNEPNICGALDALLACKLPPCPVEVIVVFNASEDAPEAVKRQNQFSLEAAKKWETQPESPLFRLFILDFPRLPKKSAGVGLARKIGMDEAVDRFHQAGNEEGVILCFDADCTCDPNYLFEVYQHFQQNPLSPGCSIRFEHPIEPGNMPEKHPGGEVFLPEIYAGITRYELYLRYYVSGLRFAGFPYAHQTIGSSMAVRSWAYQKQGGMNRRKAGEDFYFLNKIMPLGNFTELSSTRVIPSPRVSDRVPFGTGKAIGTWIENPVEDYPVYDFQSFKDLSVFFNWVEESLFEGAKSGLSAYPTHLPGPVCSFLTQEGFWDKIEEVSRHTTTADSFHKRFFSWFDGLKALKFMHFARDFHYPNTPLVGNCLSLLKALDFEFTPDSGHNAPDEIMKSLLGYFRKNDLF